MFLSRQIYVVSIKPSINIFLQIDDVYKINSGVTANHRTLTMLISSRSRVMVQVRPLGRVRLRVHVPPNPATPRVGGTIK